MNREKDGPHFVLFRRIINRAKKIHTKFSAVVVLSALYTCKNLTPNKSSFAKVISWVNIYLDKEEFVCPPYALAGCDYAGVVSRGYGRVDTLEECAQLCNDVQICSHFEWQSDTHKCIFQNRECENQFSSTTRTLHDMSNCVGFDKADKVGIQNKVEGKAHSDTELRFVLFFNLPTTARCVWVLISLNEIS